jgi:hypothetical protein
MNKKLLCINCGKELSKKAFYYGSIRCPKCNINFQRKKLKNLGVEKNPLIPNTKYGFLTVLAFHHKTWDKKQKRNVYWYSFKCKCGKLVILRKYSITNTKSCGCYEGYEYKKRLKHDKYYSHIQEIYRSYLRSAKLKVISFSLTIEQFKKLITSNCYYCNCSPNQKLPKHKWRLNNFKYIGIDRKNSKKGYIFSNVVSCCKLCNYAKHILSTLKFKKHIQKIYDYWIKK